MAEGLYKLPMLLTADLPYVLSRTALVAAFREVAYHPDAAIVTLQPLLSSLADASPLLREQVIHAATL